jgi:uncharacterized protein (DUF4415 family)
MKTIEERAEFDDYEMKEHYDFSHAVRGRFYQPKKVTETLKLDDDVLLFLKKQASEKHVAYQMLVNAVLRNYMTAGKRVSVYGETE